MKENSQERKMFYGAKPEIFKLAARLRQNMTSAELKLWEKLKNKQLGVRFKPQHPIGDFIVDFYCHKVKLVIEIDGEIHKYQKEHDSGRTYEIENYGITILRFTNDEIESNIENVLSLINTHIV